MTFIKVYKSFQRNIPHSDRILMKKFGKQKHKILDKFRKFKKKNFKPSEKDEIT